MVAGALRRKAIFIRKKKAEILISPAAISDLIQGNLIHIPRLRVMRVRVFLWNALAPRSKIAFCPFSVAWYGALYYNKLYSSWLVEYENTRTLLAWRTVQLSGVVVQE